MDLKAIEKIAAGIQAQLFKRSNSFAAGVLKSNFRGSGLQFKEHQVYMPGDEIRFIDWKLLAKMNEPFVKTFEEERNVEIYVLVDLSPTMLIGSGEVSKLQMAIEICCLLFILADRTKDKVHVILMGESVENIPSKSGMSGVVNLLSKLKSMDVINDQGKVKYKVPTQYKPDTQERSKKISYLLSRKKEVILISDFWNFLSIEEIKKVSILTNLHCIRVKTSLDNLGKSKYSLFGIGYADESILKTLFSSQDADTNDQLEKALGNKLKTLDIESNYLDEFVKDMV